MTKQQKNEKKLIQLRTKLEFYTKLEKKIGEVLDAKLDIEDWSSEVYHKVRTLDASLDDLKVGMDLPDDRWDEDESWRNK